MFNVTNEFEELRLVVLCKPIPPKGIVEAQQHKTLVNAILKHTDNQCEIRFIPSRLPEQIFTRDVGFVIGDTLFAGKMHRHRAQEHLDFLKFCGSSVRNLKELECNIEGGDVFVHGFSIFLGQSGRTSTCALKELSTALFGSKYTIYPIPFDESFLHLDCVFNIVSANLCVLYAPAMATESLQLLRRFFAHAIHIPVDEQKTLATNFLCLKPGVILFPDNNPETQHMLERIYGVKVIVLNLSEFVRERGAVRCLTQVWKRKNV